MELPRLPSATRRRPSPALGHPTPPSPIPRCWALWRELGILEGILETTYRVRRGSEGVLSSLGEGTVMLENMAFLSLWLVRFVLPALPSDSTPAQRKQYVHNTFFVCAQRLEHDVFVSVASLLRAPGDAVRLDSGSDILSGVDLPIAAAWSEATTCAPAFHCRFVYAKRTEVPLVLAPMHILQLWVSERFPDRLAMAMVSVPDSVDGGDVPRASRWHDVHKAMDPGFAHAVFTAPKEFEWRPYGNSLWVCDHGVHDGDVAGARALLSFARRLVAGGGVGRAHTWRMCRALSSSASTPANGDGGSHMWPWRVRAAP
ncbi:uncharacterized protein [Miscanthus floridulus]|uniref:uncharacterized protein n=1 Tax=Miscanthus floridulus TaxID=154761 RepID=UPI00345A6FAA